jgi:hypothetical protein
MGGTSRKMIYSSTLGTLPRYFTVVLQSHDYTATLSSKEQCYRGVNWTKIELTPHV